MQNNEHQQDRTEIFVGMTPGTEISHYRIDGRVGAGGMGEVFLATDTKLDRQAAIKFLPERLSRNTDFVSRFVREAKAAAKLNHPNIVTVYEVGDHNGRPFFAMEFVEGRTLADLITENRPSPDWIVDVATQVSSGLAAAHAKGIVHRDIKSSNIIVDESGRVRILDFGLACVDGGDNLTTAGTILGTVNYMSPEQVRGEEVDQRSDLFSLGVVMYELLTGKTPFRKSSNAATLHAITHEHPVTLPPDSAKEISLLQPVLTRLLAKNPSDRFQSATEVLEALQNLQAGVNLIDSEDTTHSIAVLPFNNNSTDPDQEYFCDGIAEDIISDLNQIPGLRVVARTSAFAFKGQSGDIRSIGEKLGVRFVLEGSVRKSGRQIRVTCQLIEVATGYQLWSKKYDRELEDIFTIQDDIARSIVEEMKLKFDKQRCVHQTSEDIPFEAYELYSRGRFELNKRTSEGFTKALESFEASQKLAPDYAPTQAGLADTYFLLFAYDKMTPRDAISRARVAVHRALTIDNQLADAHITMGGILTFHDWAWQDAEESFKKALELSPSNATGHQWYGEMLTFCGRREEANLHLQTALKLNPISPIALTMMGWHYVRFGQYEQALTFLRKAEEIGSTNDYNYSLISYCYAALGDLDHAIAHVDDSIRKLEFSEGLITTRALLHAYAGNKTPAREALDQFARIQQEAYVSQPYLAALYHILGDESSAVACLNEAIRRHDAELIFMAVMPYYAEVRSRPALNSLLAILGL